MKLCMLVEYVEGLHSCIESEYRIDLECRVCNMTGINDQSLAYKHHSCLASTGVAALEASKGSA